jgi:[ribosomal protein S5]-alanine N-acetyltransferase
LNNSKILTLESQRLLLRPVVETDLDDFFQYRSKPEIARYQLWEPFNRQQALDYILKFKDSVPGIPGQWFQLGIVLKEENKLIGDCAFKRQEHEHRIGEIGCNLSPDYQGYGYAGEALSLMLDHFFMNTDLHRVTGIADCENLASVRLLERLRMRREGHFIHNIWFKGKWGDEYSYAVLKDEWVKHRE